MKSASLAYFDRIYVINLPHRRDRRVEMAAQLRRVGLALDRDPVHLFPAVRPDSAGPFPSIGTRGCFMSHLGVLQDAERAGHARIVIFEDDVDFIETFEADIGGVIEGLCNRPWDIFYGGHRIDPALRNTRTGDAVEAVTSEVPIVTSHFVSFAGSTIGAVARYLEWLLQQSPTHPAGGPMHVDGAYTRFRQSHPACRTIISSRQLACQRRSRTDVHALRWFDKVPIVRDVAQFGRRALGPKRRD